MKGVGKNDRLNARVVRACFEKHLPGATTSSWLGELGQGIAATSRVLPTCMQLLRIKGIGPKIASFLCRDLVWAFEVEGKLPIVERIAI